MRTFIPFAMERRLFGVCLFSLLILGAVGFSQPSTLPRTIKAIEGSDTVQGYQLSPHGNVVLDPSGQVVLRLPVQQKGIRELMGLLQDGADRELFVRRFDDADNQFHLEIFRGKRGAEGKFVHEFPMDGAFQSVRFFQPPDSRDKPAVFVAVNPGSITLWTYLLAPDRQSMERLFESNGAAGGEFMDLDGDGVFELIGRGNGGSSICTFHLSPRPGPGTVPQVFLHVGSGYRQVFPPQDSEFRVVDATFSDIRPDGAVEMITIQEGPPDKPSQTLAVYKLQNRSFRRVAQTSLPPQAIAFLVDTRDAAGGREILIRSANHAECDAPHPEESGTVKAYILRGDRLEAVKP
jgi:hypothetical protein